MTSGAKEEHNMVIIPLICKKASEQMLYAAQSRFTENEKEPNFTEVKKTHFMQLFHQRIVFLNNSQKSQQSASTQYATNEKRGLVSEKTVVLRRWGSETRKFGLSTELIM